ncbi:MAG: phosphate signaling complex protein PhoU [Gammaproteobacteria bacterium]|jgi:phosphate transport system protein|nr:phosphate signaling complex protein PhoU [Gammaproteobacteria bacterium]
MSDVRRVLAREERAIHQHLLTMAELAARALDQSLASLRGQDIELARRVVSEDSEINRLHREVERECLITIASQQPVARDLREIVAGLHIASDLERIADHAAGVAKVVLEMDPSDASGPTEKILHMGELAKGMLLRAVDAFDSADADLAFSVGHQDAEVDDIHEEVLSELVMRLATGPDEHSRATHLLWIAHGLERIGDHATNVAERVIFMVSGETPELN